MTEKKLRRLLADEIKQFHKEEQVLKEIGDELKRRIRHRTNGHHTNGSTQTEKDENVDE